MHLRRHGCENTHTLYGTRRGGTHAAHHYCTLAARRGRSSSLEVEGRELDAAAGGRSEGLLAQSR